MINKFIVKLPHGYIAKWLHGYINHSAIRPFNHSKARLGFTLIELLIVIAVVGVLAVGVLTAINVTSQIGRANLSKAKTFSASVENSLAISQVGKWSFEDSSNLGKDTSGYGKDGTLGVIDWGGGGLPSWQNATTCGLGFGGCLRFDGIGSYVRLPASASLSYGSGFTLSVWIKTNTPGDAGATANTVRCIWCSETGAGPGVRFLVISDGKVGFSLVNPATVFSINSISKVTDDVWHHLLVRWDGTNTANAAKLYIDGKVENQATAGNLPASSDTLNSCLGNFPGGVTDCNYAGADHTGGDYSRGARYKGLMDEVTTYNLALTFSQVQQLYARGLARRLLALH